MYTRFDESTTAIPDNTGGGEYVYHSSRIALSVNVALATSRPLLVTGPPGSGKSTLAEDVARRLGWSFVSTTFTSRTRFEDLSARTDAVARLADAQAGAHVGREDDYLVPGVLWWAFDGHSAKELIDNQSATRRSLDPRVRASESGLGTVMLLDEVDKAEPGLPNDLLDPLDRCTVSVPGRQITKRNEDHVLVFITSNGERRLPPAFLRRCVHLELQDPNQDDLVNIARSHFGSERDELHRWIADEWAALRRLRLSSARRAPSTAEYLDTVSACIELNINPDDPIWPELQAITLDKFDAREDPAR